MHDPKQDRLSRRDLERRLEATLEENRRLRANVRDTSDEAAYAWEAMEDQLGISAGYYRIGRAENGSYWVRFKWTQGPYRDCYVIGGHETALLAFLACQVDADRVEKGKKTPIPDRPYKPKAK